MTAGAYLDELDLVVAGAVDPAAAEVDGAATFPRAAVDALGRAVCSGW